MKNRQVKFCEKLIVDDETGYILPEYAHKDIVMNYTKRYHNCIFLLARLNQCSRDLIDWLTEQMDENNIIYSNIIVRKKFIDFIASITGKDNEDDRVIYSDNTIKAAFKTLSDKGLLISKSKGVFLVNPEYFFKGDEKDRINKIVLKLEFEHGIDTKLIIEKFKK